MMAAICTEYGPRAVIRIAEVADPTPGADAVLIRVHATTVTTVDWRIRALGVAAVQIARYLGAHVTGVCSTANVDLVRSLGAAAVIDRQREDFHHGGAIYDVVLDTVGAPSFARCRNLLKPQGQFLAVLMGLTEFGQMAWTRFSGGKRVRGALVTASKADLELLMKLAEAGHLKPIIDSSCPLQRIVDAHRRVDSGRKVGSVVVTVA